MEPDQDHLLQETHRLALENNKMLRAMRRQAWIGRIITIIIYAALIGLPIWLYMTYISDTVDQLLTAYGVVEQRGQEVQGQYEGFTEAFKQFQARMMGNNGTSSAAGVQ